MTKQAETLYIFIDEGGNFDFSANGTRFFCLTAVYIQRPFDFCNDFYELKHNILEADAGAEIEYFHCCEDNYQTKKQVFELIEKNKEKFYASSIVIEKSQVKLELQSFKSFYTHLISLFIETLVQQSFSEYGNDLELFFITDAIPVKKKREGVEKAIKEAIKPSLPEGSRYKILHHDSKSHICLQIADYVNWAIYRKFTKGESEYFEKLKDRIIIKQPRNDLPN